MSTSIDEQFIEYIVKQLVSKPDAVKIDRTIDERGVLLSLVVDPEDIGRIIGKRGSTAQSLRNLLRALGTKNDARYNLKIVDVDRPEGYTPPAKSDDKPVDDVADDADDVTEPVETVETQTPVAVENDSDLAKKTREELADLDDLDI